MIKNNGGLVIGRIMNGIVIDHINPGNAMKIYDYLGLDKLDCTLAIIKNASSKLKGKKDIIKLECDPELINFEVLGFLDSEITVNIIKDGNIIDKHKLTLPEVVVNIVRCKNPRCISSIEQELTQEFYLADRKKISYRCRYCDSQYKKD